MKKNKKMRLCIACSPGGHMIQARRLAAIYEHYDHFFFTFSCPVAKDLKKTARVRTIPNITRYNPLSWFMGIILSLYYALLERPRIIITTGAGVVFFFCVFSKLLRAKVVFIESMAKVTKPTLTARLLYPFADLFIVQWPNLKKYFPKAKYLGRLL